MDHRREDTSLHERRRRNHKDGSINFSQFQRTCPSVRTDISKRLGGMQLAQATPPPPETPMSPKISSPQIEQSSLFHNYLRAFCQFDQPPQTNGNEDSSLIIAPIRPGDLILVHSIHKNGWADGTVLTTGARGWLPTNYCETFDHPYMRHLLNAMTQFWDLLGAGEDGNLSTFVRQDYIRGLIAGVRYLLEYAGCLHRNAGLVERHAGIRRMRKGLLADLATLVQIAKRLQETISEPFAGEVIHVLLDDLIAKAFRVVTRAVGFVDILAQETAATSQPYSSPVDSSNPDKGSEELGGVAIDTQTSLTKTVTTAIDSAIDLSTTQVKHESTRQDLELNYSDKNDETGPRSVPAFRPASGLLVHRLSVMKTRHVEGSTLASEQLGQVHDECISQIGAFIGLYLHSRPCSEIVATTGRLVKACKSLLCVVDQVTSHDFQQIMSVQQARTNLELKLDELTKSTKDVFKFSDDPDDDVVMLPEQTNHLINVGTNLIRTVGECVLKTRKLIEQLGDFELEISHPQDGNVEETRSTPCVSRRIQKEVLEGPDSTTTQQRRISKPLPPPPLFLRDRAMTSTGVTDFALRGHAERLVENAPTSPSPVTTHRSLPQLTRAVTQSYEGAASYGEVLKSPSSVTTSFSSPARNFSVGTSIAGSTNTRQSGMRDSGFTAVSEVSTRATTPDQSREPNSPDSRLINSFGSITSLRSAATTDTSSDMEAYLLQKTYASELTLNKDGQISGGSLPALVEQLTTHDLAPDAQFVAAFFITFRSFCNSRDLAQTLINRFDYIGDSKAVNGPVRLRIYNVFKGWLETYWNAEADREALGDIRYFALHKLKPHLPQAGERLVELTRKVTAGYCTGMMTGPLVSGVGKTSMSIGSQYGNEGNTPAPIVTKSQLNALRNAATTCSITDFDPLELARQLTLLTSKIFCEIQPEELLSLDWTKKNTPRARNVRNMCTLNTDLAHVVGDTILGPEDAKKRALVIKHWSKVATRCLELNNYDSLMAIMCSLNSSVVQRLKRTWEVVSKKTKDRLEELGVVVDFSRNHASLRSRLEKPVAPCLPFLGIYLTDLTFVDAGNPKFRELPGCTSESGETVSVINFDKHMRTAKIISHVQKFQVPYKLKDVAEMQTWIQSHLQRMREGNAAMVGQLHRRSLIIEPKDMRALRLAETSRQTEPDIPNRPKTAGTMGTVQTARGVKTTTSKLDGPKFELFLRTNLHLKLQKELPLTPGSVE